MMADDSDIGADEGDVTGEATSSGMRLPRVHLKNVVELLEKAYEHGRSPSITQVAAAVNQTLNSGAFRTRMAAAAHFGLLTPARGRVQITELGMRALDEEQRPAALVDAWMQVPIFKSLFNRFDGNRLPPASGIEAELTNLGVPSKNSAVIRRVLMSSAEQAGLLNSAADRLVIPTFDSPAMRHSGPEVDSSQQSSSPSRGASAVAGDTYTVELASGGSVSVLVNVNLFALSTDDRNFVIDLVDKLKGYDVASSATPVERAPSDEESATLPAG